jgi:hypothetical protein
MTHKIDQRIVGYSVKPQEAAQAPQVIELQETTTRPESLHGKTYKIKTPVSDHALYITINDITVNGIDRPYEVFIQSKDTDQHQWMAALTRVISAVLRKGGEVSFLCKELQEVFDPKGGYFRSGKYIPSLVHEIGAVLEKHMRHEN